MGTVKDCPECGMEMSVDQDGQWYCIDPDCGYVEYDSIKDNVAVKGIEEVELEIRRLEARLIEEKEKLCQLRNSMKR